MDEIGRCKEMSVILRNTLWHQLGTGASPVSPAHSRILSLSSPVPQCCLSEGLLSINFFVVRFAGAIARNTYRCFTVIGGGPGGFLGMISFKFLRHRFFCSRTWRDWHISDHSGLCLEGASGSVKVIAYVRLDNRNLLELGMRWSLIIDASWIFSGSMVLPKSTVFFG